jgi:hypothetical protein
MTHLDLKRPQQRSRTMKAAVFAEPGRIVLEEKVVPKVGPRDALLRVTTTPSAVRTYTFSRGSTQSHAGLPWAMSRWVSSRNSVKRSLAMRSASA